MRKGNVCIEFLLIIVGLSGFVTVSHMVVQEVRERNKIKEEKAAAYQQLLKDVEKTGKELDARILEDKALYEYHWGTEPGTSRWEKKQDVLAQESQETLRRKMQALRRFLEKGDDIPVVLAKEHQWVRKMLPTNATNVRYLGNHWFLFDIYVNLDIESENKYRKRFLIRTREHSDATTITLY